MAFGILAFGVFINEGAAEEEERTALRQEAHELKLIFTTIIKKLE